jgi:hypothetical protein
VKSHVEALEVMFVAKSVCQAVSVVPDAQRIGNGGTAPRILISYRMYRGSGGGSSLNVLPVAVGDSWPWMRYGKYGRYGKTAHHTRRDRRGARCIGREEQGTVLFAPDEYSCASSPPPVYLYQGEFEHKIYHRLDFQGARFPILGTKKIIVLLLNMYFSYHLQA